MNFFTNDVIKVFDFYAENVKATFILNKAILPVELYGNRIDDHQNEDRCSTSWVDIKEQIHKQK